MRRYYNPEMASEEIEALDWANFAVLMAAQALLGSISSNIVAVTMDTEIDSSISLNFVVDASADTDSSVVEDVLDDMDLYLSHLPFEVVIEASVRVESEYVPPPVGPRLVFLRRRG